MIGEIEHLETDGHDITNIGIDIENPKSMTRHEVMDFIFKIENLLKQFPQAEVPLKHYFSRGVYAREIFIPKGTILVGKIHKHKNLNILGSGDVSVFSIEGCQRIKPPFTTVSCAGVKRVIYAHEDTIWTTIHGTNETDLEKIEIEFTATSYDELDLSHKEELLKIGGA